MYRIFVAAAALLSSALALRAAVVPRQAPEYVINVPGGGQELLSKYKGKVVVLEFLLTTCGHCQQSSTTLSKLQREYGSKIQVLGVAINPNPDVAGFRRQFATDFPVGTGSDASARGFLQHPAMAKNLYMPQMVFIDKTGVIRAQYGGTDAFLGASQETNIRGMLDTLLGAAGGSSGAKPASGTPKPATKKKVAS